MKTIHLVSAFIMIFCLTSLPMAYSDDLIGEAYYEDTTAYKADSIGTTIGI